MRHIRIWGCPSKVRIYNPQEKKLDSMTISGHFIGYAEKSKGYRFYCPSHTTRIVESRNEKFLENDLVSGSGQFHENLSERDHYQGQAPGPSHRLFVIHTHEVESGIRQTIIYDPCTSEPIDHVIEDQQNVEQPIEQPVEQQVPHKETMLRRSIRVRNLAIPSDYVVYLQESDYNIGVEHDPQTFSQAISSKESELWYEVMKGEMDSIASNRVWDLIDLPYDVKAIGCK